MEHKGIRVEFVGQIEMFYDRGNHHDFLSLVRQLQPPGELSSSTTFSFEFSQVEKPYESYTGTNVRLRWVWSLDVCVCGWVWVSLLSLIAGTLCVW